MSNFALTVKTRGHMEAIARAIANTDPVAADKYRDSFEVRQRVEKGAAYGSDYDKPQV